MHNTSIELPEAVVEEIDDRRHSTVSRSEWIRQAIVARLEAEGRGEWEEYAPDSSEENDTDSTEVSTHASR
jgi:metal-responsive CopG/Arc/MetJ family transcriptional regulator